MKHEVRAVCVFCGSRVGARSVFRDAALRLGRILAERRIQLIYGGGSIGLMGILADAVIRDGGDVVGVMPEFLMRHEISHTNLSQLVVTKSMHDRKRKMFELADGFIVLPGGVGTLDETLEIITWKQLHLHSLPIVLVDIDGYWQPFRNLVDATISDEFALPHVRRLFSIVSSPDEVFSALVTAPTAPEVSTDPF